MSHIEQAYTHADKAILHYQRLLAGHGLTQKDKRMFRLLLIRAVFQRAEARALLSEVEQVAA